MNIHPLRKYRESFGITIEALASKVGITKASLSKIELWQRGLSLPKALKFVKATDGNVTLQELAEASSTEDLPEPAPIQSNLPQ